MSEKYNNVFDENGEVKACGREACKELIRACMEKNPGVDFGNPETGMMNIKNVKEFALA